jgi:hypothetical protein
VGCDPIVWAVEVSIKQITKIKHVVALDSHHTIFYNQQPIKNMQTQGRRDRTGLATGRGCEGSEIESILV